MEESKRCTKCGKIKLVSEFSRNENVKDGLRTWCKLCSSEYSKEKRNIKNIERWKNDPRGKTKKKMSDSHKKYYKQHPERAESTKNRMEKHIVSQATRDKISLSLTGQKYSKETCERMSVSANKRWEDPEERKRTSETQKRYLEEHPEHIEFLKVVGLGKKHTVESRKKMGSPGEKNPRWNGGITPFRKQLRECFRMNIWRREVFERDGYKDWFSGCEGSRENPIEAHHIIYLNKILIRNNIKTLEEAEKCEELWNINNGVTMLKSSHKFYHAIWGNR